MFEVYKKCTKVCIFFFRVQLKKSCTFTIVQSGSRPINKKELINPFEGGAATPNSAGFFYCKKMVCIYKIVNPVGKVYIGQTVDVNRRKKEYARNGKKNQPKISASLEKYGFANHVFEVVCECEIEELNEKERYYQDLYNVMSREAGLNLRLTTAKDRSGKLSDETKKKLSERDMSFMNGNKYRKGIEHTQEVKDKISKSLKGKGCGSKNGMFGRTADKNPFFGKKHSPELQKQISESQKVFWSKNPNPMQGVRKFGVENHFYGKLHTDEAQRLMRKNHSRSKKVIDTKTGAIYFSVNHAAESIGMCNAALRRRLKNPSLNKTNLQYL